MKPIKMIAIDLDDTLLTDDITVTERTIRAIGAARRKGLEVVIATGRMFTTARPYGRLLNLGDIPMMLYSGALVQTVETGRILFHDPIPQAAAARLLAQARQNGWMMQTYIDDVLRVPRHNHWVAEYERITGTTAVIAGDEFYEPQGAPSKVLAYGEKPELDRMAELIEQDQPGVFALMRSKDTFLEIIRHGIDTGTGLDHLCEYFNIRADNVMAIGNSPNDRGMLERAGFSVAVGNAEAEIKSLADYVTASNNDDGVAAVIEKFVL